MGGRIISRHQFYARRHKRPLQFDISERDPLAIRQITRRKTLEVPQLQTPPGSELMATVILNGELSTTNSKMEFDSRDPKNPGPNDIRRSQRHYLNKFRIPIYLQLCVVICILCGLCVVVVAVATVFLSPPFIFSTSF